MTTSTTPSTLLTGKEGYYRTLGKWGPGQAFRRFFGGEYSLTNDTYGNSSDIRPIACLFAQNHDQVGNRMLGERLGSLVPWEGLKMAAGAVLLSPFIPLLFMGEEYGETAPFLYFISHSDPELVEAVRRGRREEFSAFPWEGEIPDPQSERPFAFQIKPAPSERGHRILREFYRKLIRLRNQLSPWPF
jgi:maltooligosyltrehalose trehalohydrolase